MLQERLNTLTELKRQREKADARAEKYLNIDYRESEYWGREVNVIDAKIAKVNGRIRGFLGWKNGVRRIFGRPIPEL